MGGCLHFVLLASRRMEGGDHGFCRPFLRSGGLLYSYHCEIGGGWAASPSPDREKDEGDAPPPPPLFVEGGPFSEGEDCDNGHSILLPREAGKEVAMAWKRCRRAEEEGASAAAARARSSVVQQEEIRDAVEQARVTRPRGEVRASRAGFFHRPSQRSRRSRRGRRGRGTEQAEGYFAPAVRPSPRGPHR